MTPAIRAYLDARDRWRGVEVLDFVVLGAGLAAAVGCRTDPAVRGEVLSRLDRPVSTAQ